MVHFTAGARTPAWPKVSIRSQPEFAQRRVTIGTAAERPMVLAVRLRQRQVVDAGDAHPHQAVLVELPIFVAVAAVPMAAVVVPLIGKSHGDAVFAKGPDFLDQPVVEFARPFAR